MSDVLVALLGIVGSGGLATLVTLLMTGRAKRRQAEAEATQEEAEAGQAEAIAAAKARWAEQAEQISIADQAVGVYQDVVKELREQVTALWGALDRETVEREQLCKDLAEARHLQRESEREREALGERLFKAQQKLADVVEDAQDQIELNRLRQVEFQEELREKDRLIAQLQTQIGMLEKSNQEKDQLIAQLQTRISTLEESNRRKDRTIAQMQEGMGSTVESLSLPTLGEGG